MTISANAVTTVDVAKMASSIVRTLPRYCTHVPLLVMLAGMKCPAA
jgi:hypothetical protein